jgi:hypothetical protein
MLSAFLGAVLPRFAVPMIDIPTNPEVLESEYQRLKREAIQREKFPSRKKRLRGGLTLQVGPKSESKWVNFRALYRKRAREKACAGR